MGSSLGITKLPTVADKPVSYDYCLEPSILTAGVLIANSMLIAFAARTKACARCDVALLSLRIVELVSWQSLTVHSLLPGA